jgi:hypothetical protein
LAPSSAPRSRRRRTRELERDTSKFRVDDTKRQTMSMTTEEEKEERGS